MPQEIVHLDAIGLRTGTDKASNHHNYLRFYEPYFSRIRADKINLLEIGVLDGASLSMWSEYFPTANIIGADINPNSARFAKGRVRIELMDQSNVEDLVRVGVSSGPFDIIIDDGSHMWDHQTTSFRTLFPFLKDDGIYIIEDLQTNFGSGSPYQGIASQSCVEYLKGAVDLCTAGNINQQIEDAFLRTYSHYMTLSFYPGCCLIVKRPGSMSASRQNMVRMVPASNEQAEKSIVVEAHIGRLGDITGVHGGIVSTDPEGNIEGFALHHNIPSIEALEYRAFLEDYTWTPWVRPGKFAGTRGQTRGLLGFAIRLSGNLSSPSFQMKGMFRGATEPVYASFGDECVSPNGGALYGIEISPLK